MTSQNFSIIIFSESSVKFYLDSLKNLNYTKNFMGRGFFASFVLIISIRDPTPLFIICFFKLNFTFQSMNASNILKFFNFKKFWIFLGSNYKFAISVLVNILLKKVTYFLIESTWENNNNFYIKMRDGMIPFLLHYPKVFVHISKRKPTQLSSTHENTTWAQFNSIDLIKTLAMGGALEMDLYQANAYSLVSLQQKF